ASITSRPLCPASASLDLPTTKSSTNREDIAMTRIAALLLSLATALWAGAVSAAELKVVSAGSVRGLIAGMIEDYSRQSGHKFDFTIGTTGQLRAIINSGYPADLIITSDELMKELEQSPNLTAGSRTDLGRVGVGVVSREGAPVPDL